MVAPLTFRIVRMNPVAVVHEGQEVRPFEVAQISDDADKDMGDAFCNQRKRKMVVIDDPGNALWPDHRWDHMMAQKVRAVPVDMFTPKLAFARVHDQVRDLLIRSGYAKLAGMRNFSVADAVSAATIKKDLANA